MAKRALPLVLLCVALLAGCGEGTDATSTSFTSAPELRSERVWVDSTRTTARNGNVPEAPQRTLRTLIWQPTTAGPVGLSSPQRRNAERAIEKTPAAGPLPLLVMAHGFGGLPEKFEAMARTIADAGFVVAAPAFPLTNQNAPGGYIHALQDVANQPADVRFLISQLLEANAAADDALYGRILADDIAVLGHSLGGTTTIALTRKDCCRDPRVRASLLFAAGPIDLFTSLLGTDSIAEGPPTLVLHGTKDGTVTYASSQLLYSQIDPPKLFVGITGADHSDAIEARTKPLTSIQSVSERAIVAFLNAMFRGANAELNDTLAALAAEGNAVQSDGTLP